MIRLPRNVSIMLCPDPGYCLMQYRDDVPGNPLQFFGGWMKGFRKVNDYSKTEESLGHSVYREMVCELGLALKEIYFLPFPSINNYISVIGKENALVYLAQARIMPDWINSTRRIIPGNEIQGKLNLREGLSMGVFKLDGSLPTHNLYEPDKRLFQIYLKNSEVMEQAAFKISLDNLVFPEEKRQKLESLITVRA